MKDLLTVEQAAEYLTLNVNTLNAWRSKGEGPTFIRVGRSVRYKKADLDDYLKAGTVKTK